MVWVMEFQVIYYPKNHWTLPKKRGLDVFLAFGISKPPVLRSHDQWSLDLPPRIPVSNEGLTWDSRSKKMQWSCWWRLHHPGRVGVSTRSCFKPGVLRKSLLGCRRKLGSMVSQWVITYFQWHFQGPSIMGPLYGKFPILFPYHSHKNP